MEVEMKIRGLMMDPVTNMPIVILKDVSGNTRPADLGGHLRGQRHRARDREGRHAAADDPRSDQEPAAGPEHRHARKWWSASCKDDTFYAVIWLERDGELISVDSRPSDALALALRLDCPIFVEDAVLKSPSWPPP